MNKLLILLTIIITTLVSCTSPNIKNQSIKIGEISSRMDSVSYLYIIYDIYPINRDNIPIDFNKSDAKKYVNNYIESVHVDTIINGFWVNKDLFNNSDTISYYVSSNSMYEIVLNYRFYSHATFRK